MFNWLTRLFRKKSPSTEHRFGWPDGYIVDVTKGPIAPPNRIYREGFKIESETTESIQQTEKWRVYIREYKLVHNVI